MQRKYPIMILTGASGIVGRNFLQEARDHFFIYALARRSQQEAKVAQHSNIRWIQVDIGNQVFLKTVIHNIKKFDKIEYILHLAGYYDFDLVDNPEYKRTNINGTRFMLEQAKLLKVKRFIFASSTAGCKFPPAGKFITENDEIDADYAYARSKREGEKMLEEFSAYFPCSAVRFAAVFTDWCEYAPLYNFLKIWLSKKWNSRVLGGKGESAVTFIHPKNLNKLLISIFRKSGQLPDFDTYIASPDGFTSHKDLYKIATEFYYKRDKQPIFMPKFLSYIGVVLMNFLGKLIGKRPFEQPWMIKYLDLVLNTDSSLTRKKLSFQLDPAFHIKRRLIFLIEKMISQPGEWHRQNQKTLTRVTQRPNLLLFENMIMRKDECTNILENKGDNLTWAIKSIYRLLSQAVLRQDRRILLRFASSIACITFSKGVDLKEFCLLIGELEKKIITLLRQKGQTRKKRGIYWTHITITLRLLVKEIEYTFSDFKDKTYDPDLFSETEIETEIDDLERFYKIPPEGFDN